MIYIIGNSKLGRRVQREIGGSILVSRSNGAEYTREWFKKNLKAAKAIVFATGRISSSWNALKEEHIRPLEELVAATDSKIVLASSISVYGKKHKQPIDENTPLRPDTPYARAKAVQEKLLEDRDSAILRLGVLYGEEYEIYFKMLSMICRGVAPIVGKGDNNVPFTYVGSAAKFFATAVRLRGIYNVSGEGCIQKYAITLAKERLNKKAIEIHVPPEAGVVCDFLGCSFNTEALLSISSDRKVLSKKAGRKGFKDIPIEKGIEMVVKEFMERRRWKR